MGPSLLALKAYTTAHKRRDTWLAARRGGIGSSDAAAVLGESKWRTPMQVWADKKGLIEDEGVQTAIMRRGHAMEEVVAREYLWARNPQEVPNLWNPGQHAITWHSWGVLAHASVDRFIINENGDVGVLECKTAGFNTSDWTDDLPPKQYWLQVQHQLFVTGCKWAVLAVIFPSSWEYREYPLEPSETWHRALEKAYKSFWESVEADEPPEPEAGDSKLLAKLYPQAPEDTENPENNSVVLGMDIMELDEQRVEVASKLAELKDEKATIDNKIKKSMGSNTIGILPGVRYTWKDVTTQDRLVKGSTSRRLTRRELKDS